MKISEERPLGDVKAGKTSAGRNTSTKGTVKDILYKFKFNNNKKKTSDRLYTWQTCVKIDIFEVSYSGTFQEYVSNITFVSRAWKAL